MDSHLFINQSEVMEKNFYTALRQEMLEYSHHANKCPDCSQLSGHSNRHLNTQLTNHPSARECCLSAIPKPQSFEGLTDETSSRHLIVRRGYHLISPVGSHSNGSVMVTRPREVRAGDMSVNPEHILSIGNMVRQQG